jgi:hypothetical protein
VRRGERALHRTRPATSVGVPDRGSHRTRLIFGCDASLLKATVAMSALAHEPERWEAVLRRLVG